MKPDTPTRDPHRAPIFDGTAVTTHKTIEVLEVRPLVKGVSLRGFFTIKLPDGMIVCDLTLHQREDGSRWCGWPAKPYVAKDGSQAWTKIIDFVDRETGNKFQREVLEALDRHLAGLPTDASPQREQPHQQRLAPEVRKPRVPASPEITDDDIDF